MMTMMVMIIFGDMADDNRADGDYVGDDEHQARK